MIKLIFLLCLFETSERKQKIEDIKKNIRDAILVSALCDKKSLKAINLN